MDINLSNRKERILITGAAGFVGGSCLQYLLNNESEVHAVGLNVPDEQVDLIYWHKADLLNPECVGKLIAEIKPDKLMHFAWVVKPGEFWHSDENHKWLEASMFLLKKFAENGGKRVVMAGSCAEYDWSSGICSENTPLKPKSLYGTCKESLFRKLDEYSKDNKISYAWGRLFFLYGPRENNSRLIPSIINSLLNDEMFIIQNGSFIRDFIHVEDAASAFVSLLNSDITGPVNIGSGQGNSIQKIAEIIENKTGKKELVKFAEHGLKKEEGDVIVANIDRLKFELGWQPGYNLETGLQNVIEWWEKQNLVNLKIQ